MHRSLSAIYTMSHTSYSTVLAVEFGNFTIPIGNGYYKDKFKILAILKAMFFWD